MKHKILYGMDNLIIDDINIHHNYFHYNQQKGMGYGIQFDTYCYGMVYANIFDYNRHSIEGSGEQGTSYEAYHNLQLNNVIDHAFDMHHVAINNKPPPPSGDNIHGGDQIKIHHNSFWVWHTCAIGIAIPLQHDSLPSDPPHPQDGSADITMNFFANKPDFINFDPSTSYEDANGNNDDINPYYPTNLSASYLLMNQVIKAIIKIYNNKYGDTICP